MKNWFVALILIFFSHACFAKGILYIGDSHSVWTFGEALDAKLRTFTKKVNLFASCGSRPQWWFDGTSSPCGYSERKQFHFDKTYKTHSTPLFSDLIKEYAPDTLIIEIGGNLYGWPREQIQEEVAQLLSVIPTTVQKCFWIGPPDYLTKDEADIHHPNYKNLKDADVDRETVSIIRSVVERSNCQFIDSKMLTHYPVGLDGDGIHYEFEQGKPLAKNWARKVFQIIKEIYNSVR